MEAVFAMPFAEGAQFKLPYVSLEKCRGTGYPLRQTKG